MSSFKKSPPAIFPVCFSFPSNYRSLCGRSSFCMTPLVSSVIVPRATWKGNSHMHQPVSLLGTVLKPRALLGNHTLLKLCAFHRQGPPHLFSPHLLPTHCPSPTVGDSRVVQSPLPAFGVPHPPLLACVPVREPCRGKPATAWPPPSLGSEQSVESLGAGEVEPLSKILGQGSSRLLLI